MSRTLVNRWSPGTPAVAREAEPWVSTGALTGSTVVKAAGGLLGGVLVTATDAGGDIDVIVWDSPNSTLTDDEALARVTVTTTTAKAQASFVAPSGCGVQATLGIYVQIVAGDAQVIVYYK